MNLLRRLVHVLAEALATPNPTLARFEADAWACQRFATS